MIKYLKHDVGAGLIYMKQCPLRYRGGVFISSTRVGKFISTTVIYICTSSASSMRLR